ncbi:hypothetical protein DCC85_11420 [Paenibacillus sp. CAA11]|nr:hypothetical protein DCC85_11420 [Paenibacillus sp. CAA11]
MVIGMEDQTKTCRQILKNSVKKLDHDLSQKPSFESRKGQFVTCQVGATAELADDKSSGYSESGGKHGGNLQKRSRRLFESTWKKNHLKQNDLINGRPLSIQCRGRTLSLIKEKSVYLSAFSSKRRLSRLTRQPEAIAPAFF